MALRSKAIEKKAATPIQLEQLEVEYAATKKKLEGVKKQHSILWPLKKAFHDNFINFSGLVHYL